MGRDLQDAVGVRLFARLSVFFDESSVDQFLQRPSHLAISPMRVGPPTECLQTTLPAQLGQ